MKKIFLFSFCIVGLQTINAQVPTNSPVEETQRFQNMLSKNIKTLIINLSSFSINSISEFKDELSGWEGKVISIDLNEETKIISVTHNQLLGQKEIDEVLKKYFILKDFIISHN